MVKPRHFPDQGDIIWLDFNPQIGREQAKRRPALVLSPAEYNQKVGLLIACPITSKIKNYPFEVPVQFERKVGVILSDQVKSLDWRERKATFIIKCPEDILKEVQENIAVLIGREG